MSRRWDYLGLREPDDTCPHCSAPSKSYHQGSKTVDGVKITRFKCEHQHEWTVSDPPTGDKP